jgi:hypothetical protein
MRSRLIIKEDGSKEWVKIMPDIKTKPINNVQGEDLTVGGYIDKYGGIYSNVDNKIYTSKSSYMEHLKANDCIIKDW